MATKTGKITQIIGPVIDVDFGEDASLPPIYNALNVKLGKTEIIAEVVKHLEPGKVRAISLSADRWLGARRGSDRHGTYDRSAGGRRNARQYFRRAWAIHLRNRKNRSKNSCRSIAKRRNSPSNRPKPRFLKRASRSSTSCAHLSKAVK